MGAVGLESSKSDGIEGFSGSYEGVECTNAAEKPNDLDRRGPGIGPTKDGDDDTEGEGSAIERAVAYALRKAADAGQWAVVAQLARELEARRLSGSNVVPLAPSSRKGV